MVSLVLLVVGCASPVEVETIEENQSFDFSQCEVFGQTLSVGEDQMLCCEVHAKN